MLLISVTSLIVVYMHTRFTSVALGFAYFGIGILL